MRALLIVCALLLGAPAWGEVVKCPDGTTWAGADVRTCPCCEMCPAGGWVVRGAETCDSPTVKRRRAAESARSSRQEAEAIELRMSSAISAKCDRQWPNDEAMRRHCWRRLQDGKLSVGKILDAAAGDDAKLQGISACVLQWVGSDFRRAEWDMAAICAERELTRDR